MTEDRTVIFSDESGFYLLPHVIRSYAPRGQTPIIRHRLTRDHLSVINAVTAEGRLLISVQRESYKSAGIIKFLRYLLAKVPGKLLLVWDGAPIHRSQAIRAFLTDLHSKPGQADRLQLERLPGYAPELNPAEGVWQWLKCVALKNIASPNLDLLHSHMRRAIYQLRQRPSIIQGCARATGLY